MRPGEAITAGLREQRDRDLTRMACLYAFVDRRPSFTDLLMREAPLMAVLRQHWSDDSV